MKRSVLFVTSPPTPDQIPVLQNLTQKAAGQNVQVNVWIIVPAEAFQTAGATALKDLAIQTGGQYILY